MQQPQCLLIFLNLGEESEYPLQLPSPFQLQRIGALYSKDSRI